MVPRAFILCPSACVLGLGRPDLLQGDLERPRPPPCAILTVQTSLEVCDVEDLLWDLLEVISPLRTSPLDLVRSGPPLCVVVRWISHLRPRPPPHLAHVRG